MPYRKTSRALSLRPVKSEKHEGTWSNLIQDASATKEIIIVKATAGEPSAPQDVETGSTIRSVYFETNLNGVDNSGASTVFHWQIYKNPSGFFGALDPAIYDTDKKRFTLKRGMEMLPAIPLGSGGTVQTKRIFVIKIPPRMSRFGENDELVLTYKNTSASAINYCGITIFKEFK